MYDVKLRPIHYASVSGGKDSLYMLGLILSKPDKYPLDIVVNFDLEIDWKESKDCIDLIEKMCNENSVKFMKIQPRVKWIDIYNKYGFPHRMSRWCNSEYKLDCKRQLHEWIKSQNCRPIAYIGFCADEVKRFKYNIGDDWSIQDVCYPLAEEGIKETTILEWARKQSVFGVYYKLFNRMGCKICPMAIRLEWAYLLKFYPDEYSIAIDLIKETRNMVLSKGRKYDFANTTPEKFDSIIRNKWLPILNKKLEQIERR